jgi:fluoroquinolone transport system ATP-binding protein
MINVKNLFHSYTYDKNYAVKNVSFDVERGEIFGFLGPNGAGKSTTQKILTGLLPLQKGQVTLNNKKLTERKIFFEEIGVSFEHPNLYKKLSGLENLKFYSNMFSGETEDVNELLDMVDLLQAGNKRVESYSKGMKQRLVFARSLINKPLIWFLDEPISGLDPASARNIKDIIMSKKKEDTTVFLTTHNMNVAEELCDRIALINNGEIVTIDTPRNLKIKYGKRAVEVEYLHEGAAKKETLLLDREEDKKHFSELFADDKIERVHSQEATLETVFLKLTGMELKSHEK